MELEKIKEELQLEYNQLLSKLEQLKIKQEKLKQKYQETEEKFFRIYNETAYIGKDVLNDTEEEEKREDEFINSKTQKKSTFLRLSVGTITAIIFLIIFLTILFTTNSYTVTKMPLIIGFTISSFSLGYGIGGIFYLINQNKYKNKLKEQYKSSKEHSKHSINHYDKQLYLERKCKELNTISNEYEIVKKEYQELTNQINLKKQEIEQFKIKAFNIIFTQPTDNIVGNNETQELITIDNHYQDQIPVKQRKLTSIKTNDKN